MLTHNEISIGRHIKYKPKDIFVKLVALQTNMVVTTKLIIVINATHVLVQEDDLGELRRNAGTISLLPHHLLFNHRIAIGSCQRYHFVVLPCCHGEVTYVLLSPLSFSPFFTTGLSVSGKPFLLVRIVPHQYSLSASRLLRKS